MSLASIAGIPSVDQINQSIDHAAAQIGTLEQNEIQALKDFQAQFFANLKTVEDPLLIRVDQAVSEISQIRQIVEKAIGGIQVTFGPQKE